MKILDLFSGLGGASEAFVRSGHEVFRIDNNLALRDVPNTQIADVSLASGFKFDNYGSRQHFELIWASPPCLDFSQGYNGPRPTARRAGIPFTPSLDEVKLAKDIIDELKPKYWIIENVVGAIKDFQPILGAPTQIIGPFVLWGKFPAVILPKGYKHTKASNDPHSSDPLRSNKKAKIPLEISKAVLDAISTPTLVDFRSSEGGF